ncbi:MAG: aminotransferase class I/II-fold pyridoxal phosphate-dependent enzyme [Planctomycetota bacterium]
MERKKLVTVTGETVAHREFADAIRRRLGGEGRVFLYWKGRVALYALLEAIGVEQGDEVILPAYTCVVVPNAILYAGGTPVYVDVRPETYCMDVAKLPAAISDRTKAILCQNTYGLSADVEKVVAIARDHGVATVEDCAHGFGGTYKGRPNGTYCDAAFFSSQWNKPFSTGLGGFAAVNNPELVPAVEALEKEKAAPGPREAVALRALLVARKCLLNDLTYWPLRAAYRWLSERDLILGSSRGQELDSAEMPDDYFKAMSPVQAKAGLRALAGLDELLDRRRRNAETYTRFLENHGKTAVPRALFPDHSFLKYPLLVRDRAAFSAAAETAHVPLGDWFVSPIHPVPSHLERWGFEPAQFPVAGRLAAQVVNLPTESRTPQKVLAFLDRRLDLVL